MTDYISRQTAIKKGLTQYFTGKPCCKGHIAPQSVHGGCVVCNAERATTSEYKARRQRYYAANQKQIKRKNNAARIKRLYGISEVEYLALFEAQHGVCAICGTAHKSGRRLCIDHDHASGRIRGLLCNDCNKVIVATMDRHEGALQRLINYMNR